MNGHYLVISPLYAKQLKPTADKMGTCLPIIEFYLKINNIDYYKMSTDFGIPACVLAEDVYREHLPFHNTYNIYKLYVIDLDYDEFRTILLAMIQASGNGYST